MKYKLLLVSLSLFGCLMVMCENAAAITSWGANCINCHSVPGNIMEISPDPITLPYDASGMITFDIISLPEGSGIISLEGLEDYGLDFSVLSTGDTWTYEAGPWGESFISDIITTTGPYNLGISIGSGAMEGMYDIQAALIGVGPSDYGSSYDFTINIGEYQSSVPQIAESKTPELWFAQIGPSPTSAQVNLVLESSSPVGAIDFEIFDARGRKVAEHREIASGRQLAWTWNGRSSDGGHLSSGVYWIQARSGKAMARERIVLIR